MNTITIRDIEHLNQVLNRICALCGQPVPVDEVQFLNNELIHEGGCCPDEEDAN
jgi:hypothetical protein